MTDHQAETREARNLGLAVYTESLTHDDAAHRLVEFTEGHVRPGLAWKIIAAHVVYAEGLRAAHHIRADQGPQEN